MSKMSVCERNGLFRHGDAQSGRAPPAQSVRLGGRKPRAPSAVQYGAVGKVRRAGGVQIGPGTEARVNAGMFFQHLQGLCVQFAAFTLKIGAVRPASPAAFVPIQPQPGQVLLQKARVLRLAASDVQIFDPQ